VVSRVDGSTGTVLDPNGFSVGNSFCISVSVTTVTNRWLAVFRSNTTHDNPVGSTFGTFVNTDGTKSSTFLIYGPSGAPGNGRYGRLQSLPMEQRRWLCSPLRFSTTSRRIWWESS
jgi:hypothetical protein